MKTLSIVLSFCLLIVLSPSAKAAHQCYVSLLQRELSADDGLRIYPGQGLIKVKHVTGESTVHIKILGIPKAPDGRNTYKLSEVPTAEQSHFTVTIGDTNFDGSKMSAGYVGVSVGQHGAVNMVSIASGEFSRSSHLFNIRKGENAIAVLFCVPLE